MTKQKWAVVTGAAAAVAAALVAYRQRAAVWQRVLGLPPTRNEVDRETDVRVAMADGLALATDVYRPRGGGRHPTVLIRTPYGRGVFVTTLPAQRMAERGYNVVAQDCRGRGGSDGVFEPYVNEASDGKATIEWIREQPWSDGQVGMWGHSYVGYVQWAAASTGVAGLKALVPSITSALLSRSNQGAVRLEMTLRWLYMLELLQDASLGNLGNTLRLLNPAEQDRVVLEACEHLPLRTADEQVVGKPVSFYRTWMAQEGSDSPYWRAVDFREEVQHLDMPIQLISGWYDIFLDGLLDDYAALVAAGRQPYLTIGPWQHQAVGNNLVALQEGLAWFDAHLKGEQGRLRAQPVRLYVMGAKEWRAYAAWPPPGEKRTFYLQADGQLGAEMPAAGSPPDTYVYDPAQPTPNVGGALLGMRAGAHDNRGLEARDDVLTYTSAPLITPLEIIGPVEVVLFVRSNREHTDFMARLCDVQPDGRSLNVCDGFVRLEPGDGEPQPDGSLRIVIRLSPTAQRFQPGHRVRLQVSSGAHPRIARNPGTGESLVGSTAMVTQAQTVFHDAERPSALIVAVVGEMGTA